MAYTPLRFSGQYFDFETQLRYNLQRYYAAEAGRDLSNDPLRSPPHQTSAAM
ncbi:RHS repeat-associated core domain-containing protein [Streptomyces sp. MST-110588]|uniref:RHS repeat-associated core domain-containing protein n=1 Tax=Streptomyces sp. MST-110588 TaxID=2833628 RepID=UPI001F5D4270|nr:RHS repeat-associated core domain-containing protein [Streptomyces sp. MST-110588]UNO41074.1 hypothetical protein KGS77_17635 [Streptomyces sp. MST-110588]